jgi:hypothetical protein
MEPTTPHCCALHAWLSFTKKDVARQRHEFDAPAKNKSLSLLRDGPAAARERLPIHVPD